MLFFTGGYGEKSLKSFELIENQLKLIDEYDESNASYVIVSKYKEYLFCCIEEELGAVVCYRILPNSKLEKIDYLVTNSAMPCHLSLSDDETILFVANYMGGSVDIIQVDEGRLKHVNTIQNKGSGPNVLRQEMAHAHYVSEVPESKTVSICDLGIDNVSFINFDNLYQKMTSRCELSIEPGSGPRHLAFNETKNIFYLLNELSNTCHVYSYNLNSEEFVKKQEFSLGVNDGDISSAIRISEKEEFLFTATRGCDKISVFRIEASGELKEIVEFHSGGSWVRDLNIKGNVIVVANQNSDSINVFQMKGINITEVSSVFTKSPTCICFLSDTSS